MQNDNILEEYLRTAQQAARQAGALLRARFGTDLRIDKKGRINVVTEADLASEKMIRELIASRFPEHSFLGEESGSVTHGGAPRWIVDPLDGTTNFAQGYPFFSVSIALEIENGISAGVVYDPIRDEMFHAAKDRGAFLNGQPIRVTGHSDLEEALLVTGFPYEIRKDPDTLLAIFRDMVTSARGIRRDGSAALDLCYVACGRFDAFWEIGLHPWDMAAGSLILQEAGGRITNFQNEPHDLFFQDMLASNSLLHQRLLAILDRHKERLCSSPLMAQTPIC